MILCLGECLIDMIPIKTKSGDAYLPKVGGAMYNSAIALGRLKANVGFCSLVSNDLFGKMIIKELEKSNVNTKYCIRCDNKTTLAFVSLIDGLASYTFFDENSNTKMLSSIPILDYNIKAIQIGGISLMKEPSSKTIINFIKQNKKYTIYYDPNIRDSFIDNKDIFIKQFENLLPFCDIIKVSDEDLSWIYPNLSFDEASNKILSFGIKIFILTKGKDESIIKTKQYFIKIKPKKTKVIDSVGAGDIFNAGILYSLQNNLDKLICISKEQLKDALIFANKVAGMSLSKQGANSHYLKEVL